MLESQIVRDVATYGAQLGPLSAIALALSKGEPAPADALGKLQDICREIEQKKQAYRQGAAQRAREALTDLAEQDPTALTAVLAELTGPFSVSDPEHAPGR